MVEPRQASNQGSEGGLQAASESSLVEESNTVGRNGPPEGGRRQEGRVERQGERLQVGKTGVPALKPVYPVFTRLAWSEN